MAKIGYLILAKVALSKVQLEEMDSKECEISNHGGWWMENAQKWCTPTVFINEPSQEPSLISVILANRSAQSWEPPGVDHFEEPTPQAERRYPPRDRHAPVRFGFCAQEERVMSVVPASLHLRC